MGKRLSDLHLDDNPIEVQQDLFEARADQDAAATTVADIRETEWYQFVSRIEDLLAGDEYLWAFDTLDAIKATVETTHRVSAGQQRAVTNIENRGETNKYRRPFGRWR